MNSKRRSIPAAGARSAWILGFLLAPGAVFTAASCSSTPPPTGLASGCEIDSDCTGHEICAFGRCHEQCATSKDCMGATCLPEVGGNVCELTEELMCSSTLPCVTGLTCADDTCRTPCSQGLSAGAPGGCLEGQTCTAVSGSKLLVCLDNKGGGSGQGDGGGGGTSDATTSDGKGGSIRDGGGGADANTCPSAQTAFGNTAQGEMNAKFTSGVGVRTATQLLIFSSYVGGPADAGDAGGMDNVVYVQAFDSMTAKSLGAAKTLFDAPDGAGFVLDSASVAPTGEVALAFSYGGPFSYTKGSQYTQTSLYAAFLGASADAGPVGLALQGPPKELASGQGPVGSAHNGISGQPHIAWSAATGAFVFSWLYQAASDNLGTANFLPSGASVGGTDPVPSDQASGIVFAPNAYGLNWVDQGSFAAGPTLSGVAFVSNIASGSGSPWLTVLDQSSDQVGGAVQIAPMAGNFYWTTVGATAEGFVYLYDNPTTMAVSEFFIPTSGDAGIVLPDAGDAGLPGVTFTGVRALNAHAINDDTGGSGGVGVAMLYPTGLSFAYVKADGKTHVGPSPVMAHTYAPDDLMNVMNFGGSFAVSLYDSVLHSTQVAASGCQ
jgi:hypothetical protein